MAWEAPASATNAHGAHNITHENRTAAVSRGAGAGLTDAHTNTQWVCVGAHWWGERVVWAVAHHNESSVLG